ncbi:unnamed protein product [Pleuronectes platessa]|uniref:Uncharacterized protein n=1 Tax=Pleuronectes platessa TaxID=8262 RepID=A0A9N7Z5Q5_PLEPL|nr:unnamed protein product [Pleuronectes platessa]
MFLDIFTSSRGFVCLDSTSGFVTHSSTLISRHAHRCHRGSSSLPLGPWPADEEPMDTDGDTAEREEDWYLWMVEFKRTVGPWRKFALD